MASQSIWVLGYGSLAWWALGSRFTVGTHSTAAFISGAVIQCQHLSCTRLHGTQASQLRVPPARAWVHQGLAARVVARLYW